MAPWLTSPQARQARLAGVHPAGHLAAQSFLCAVVVFFGTRLLLSTTGPQTECAESGLLRRYGLFALHFILAVNSTPTPTLDAFVEAVSKLEDRSWVRLKLVSTCAVASLELRFCPLPASCKLFGSHQ